MKEGWLWMRKERWERGWGDEGRGDNDGYALTDMEGGGHVGKDDWRGED